MTMKDDELNKVAGGVGSGGVETETYTVVEHDTLTRIADHYRRVKHWPGVTVDKIVAWNPELIKDRNFIKVGWKLRIYNA